MMVIYQIYAEHYHIWKITVDTSDVGHSGTRGERVYIILAHKQRTVQLQDPIRLYEFLTGHIQSILSTRPRDYFFSSRREIQLAATEFARTRRKKMKPAS